MSALSIAIVMVPLLATPYKFYAQSTDLSKTTYQHKDSPDKLQRTEAYGRPVQVPLLHWRLQQYSSSWSIFIPVQATRRCGTSRILLALRRASQPGEGSLRQKCNRQFVRFVRLGFVYPTRNSIRRCSRHSMMAIGSSDHRRY